MNDLLLEATGLTKRFGENVVLDGVDLSVERGEVHAIVGENGAGKSTLIKILGGVHRADGGKIRLDGRDRSLASPRAAIENGIVVIHQELSLAPHLNTVENIFLGHFLRNALGMLDNRRMRLRTDELLKRLSIEIDPEIPVGRLSIAQQQMIEIAKAISVKAKLLILDEPTAVLDSSRVDTLFSLIERLKADGIGVVFISHHLDEVFRIADRVTVLRDGSKTGSSAVSEVDHDWLVSRMIGREFEGHSSKKRDLGEVVLELDGLYSEGAFEKVSLSVCKGEIVGLAGLIGAGRTEVAQAIFGVRPHSGGTMRLNGAPVKLSGPRAATQMGIAYVSEDRKAYGLLPNRPVHENMTISNLARFVSFGVLRLKQERSFVGNQIKQLDIRLPGMQAEIRTLSGGNQQKALLGRALASQPKVLIFDEPTRGVDIGAKREIYRFIEELAEEGAAILVISSEMEEVIRLSDRIVVMRSGRVAAEIPREKASEETIMRAASLA